MSTLGPAPNYRIQLRRATRPVLISVIYLLLFTFLDRLTVHLQFLPQLSSWNLKEGLTFGLLLSHGLVVVPAVLTAHAFTGFYLESIPEWHAVFVASGLTCLYALAAMAVRKQGNRPEIDLTSRKTLMTWILITPVIAVATCGMLVVTWAYTGLIPRDEVFSAVLRGSLGNISGILLITPLVVLGRECWSRTSIQISTLAAWLDKKWERIGLSKGAVDSHKITLPWRPALFLAAVLACVYYLLHYSISDTFLFFCLVSIPVVFMSLRFGLHGTAVSLAAFGFLAVGKVYTGDWVGIWIECVVTTSALNAIGIGSLVSDRNQQRFARKREGALLNSVGFATEQLLGMTDRDKNVNEVLKQLAKEAEVSRIYVLENRQELGRADFPVVYECSVSSTNREEEDAKVTAIRSRQIARHAAALAESCAISN